eukprot:gene9560-14837_t
MSSAAVPVFTEQYKSASFDSELLDLADAGTSLTAEELESLFEGGYNAKVVATALQLIELCSKRRDEALVHLHEARDAVQQTALFNWCDADYPGQAYGDKRAEFELLQQEVDHWYGAFKHYDGLVDKARRKIHELYSEPPRRLLPWGAAAAGGAEGGLLHGWPVSEYDADSKRPNSADQEPSTPSALSVSKRLLDIRQSIDALAVTPKSTSVTALHHALSFVRSASSFKAKLRNSRSFASRFTKADHAKILLIQRHHRGCTVRRKFGPIRAMYRTRNDQLRREVLHALAAYVRAARHRNGVLLRYGFAGILGSANIRAFRRAIGCDVLRAVRGRSTVRNAFLMWHRYASYIASALDKETGYRQQRFDTPFPLWDAWVDADADVKRKREHAKHANLGDATTKAFTAWVRYTEMRKLKRLKTLLARSHWAVNTLRKHYEAWGFVVLNALQVGATVRATQIYYLLRWKTLVRQQREDARLLVSVQRISRARYFASWRRRTDRRELMTVASGIKLQANRPLGYLATYALRYETDQQSRNLFPFVLCWHRWKAHVADRRLFQCFLTLHHSDYTRHLLSTCLVAWHAHTARKQQPLSPTTAADGAGGPAALSLVPPAGNKKSRVAYLQLKSRFDGAQRVAKLAKAVSTMAQAGRDAADWCATGGVPEGLAYFGNEKGFKQACAPAKRTILSDEVPLPDFQAASRSVAAARSGASLWSRTHRERDPTLFGKIARLCLQRAEGVLALPPDQRLAVAFARAPHQPYPVPPVPAAAAAARLAQQDPAGLTRSLSFKQAPPRDDPLLVGMWHSARGDHWKAEPGGSDDGSDADAEDDADRRAPADAAAS